MTRALAALPERRNRLGAVWPAARAIALLLTSAALLAGCGLQPDNTRLAPGTFDDIRNYRPAGRG
jgi:hypothetical protein